MEALRSIVYVSSAVRTMTEPELEALLAEARAFNERTEVTGVLLYHEGSFIQCLEGPAQAVSKAFERIRRSRQHGGIIVLIDEAVAERSFAGWQMGFSHAGGSEMLAISSAQWQAQVDREGGSASVGMFLLRDFWQRLRR